MKTPAPKRRRWATATGTRCTRSCASWRYDLLAGAEVHGTTLGIIGMGRIGQAIARRAVWGFGMQVLYHNRQPLDTATEAACRARYVGKEELLRNADHVMLVCVELRRTRSGVI